MVPGVKNQVIAGVKETLVPPFNGYVGRSGDTVETVGEGVGSKKIILTVSGTMSFPLSPKMWGA